MLGKSDYNGKIANPDPVPCLVELMIRIREIFKCKYSIILIQHFESI